MTRPLALAGFVAVALAAGAAHAQQKATILTTEWLRPPPPRPDAPPPYPILRAKVGANGVSLKKEDFSLKVSEGEKPTTIPASKMEPFAESKEQMSVVILVQGTVRFMGNPNPEKAEGET